MTIQLEPREVTTTGDRVLERIKAPNLTSEHEHLRQVAANAERDARLHGFGWMYDHILGALLDELCRETPYEDPYARFSSTEQE